MIRLNLPSELLNYSDIIEECCSRNTQYTSDVLSNKQYLLGIGNDYEEYARLNNLYRFDTDFPIEPDGVICNTLSNSHMVKLYDYCLRDCRSGGVYDAVLNSAKNPKIRCPFCGGINTPSQIDHFLPKSRYGHFSVFPYNLIPICKDCNTEFKGEFFPTEKNKQLIHPYLDEDCFFNEQWLYAEYIDDGTEFGTVSYYLVPPSGWSDDKKNKIKFHFEKFHLADRFSEFSSGNLSDILVQMKSHKMNGAFMEDFEKCSIDSVITKERKANHWKKALFQAVKAKLSVIWGRI